MPPKPILALNATVSIIVKNLVKDKDGLYEPFLMPRVAATAQEPRLRKWNPDPTTVPKRPPSNLPSPGDIQLSLEIQELIGVGCSSEVYAVSVANRSSSILSPSDVEIPALALKVAYSSAATSLGCEAWYYDEMEILQGSMVPHNFGLFSATIRENHGFALSDPEKNHSGLVSGVVSVLLLERAGDVVPFDKDFDGGNDIPRLDVVGNRSSLDYSRDLNCLGKQPL